MEEKKDQKLNYQEIQTPSLTVDEILAQAKRYREMDADDFEADATVKRQEEPVAEVLVSDVEEKNNQMSAKEEKEAVSEYPSFAPMGEEANLFPDKPAKKKNKPEKVKKIKNKEKKKKQESFFEKAPEKEFKLSIQDEFIEELEPVAPEELTEEAMEQDIQKTVEEHKRNTTEILIPKNFMEPQEAIEEDVDCFDDSFTRQVDLANMKKKKVILPTEPVKEPEEELMEGQILLDAFSPAEPDPEFEPMDYNAIEKDLKLSRQKKVSGFVLNGEEEENDPLEESFVPAEEEEPETIDDFTCYEDTLSIKTELISQKRRVMARSMLTFLTLLAGLYLVAVNRFGLRWPSSLLSAENPLVFLIANASLLVLAFLINLSVILDSIAALCRGKPNSDSALSLALTAVLLQNLTCFGFLSHVKSGQISVYSFFILLALFVQLTAKNAIITRIKKNFFFVCRRENKKVLVMAEEQDARELLKGVFVPNFQVAHSGETEFLTNYLHNAYEPDNCDNFGRKWVFISLAAAFVAAVVSGVINSSELPAALVALTSFAAVCCFSLPIGSLTAMNRPLLHAVKRLSQKGVMLTGIGAAEDFCDTNVVALDAHDLFSRGYVDMSGYRTFNGSRLDEVILDAAALSISAGGPLSEVFRKIIDNRLDMLPKAESIVYEKDMGVSGWVDGRRVLVGNRVLMKHHEVDDIPSKDYEDKHVQGDRRAVYLSVSRGLSAMFVVSYSPNEALREQLQKLEKNNLLLLVRTCDANVTTELISQVYGIPEKCVQIMSAPSGRLFDEIRSEPAKEAESSIAYTGKISAMFEAVYTTMFLKRLSLVLNVLQCIGCVLGLVLSVLFAVTSGLSQLTALRLVLFQMFWLLCILILPLFGRDS